MTEAIVTVFVPEACTADQFDAAWEVLARIGRSEGVRFSLLRDENVLSPYIDNADDQPQGWSSHLYRQLCCALAETCTAVEQVKGA